MNLSPVEIDLHPIVSNLVQRAELLVLQPKGCLDQETSSSFQVALEQAVRRDVTIVIVDLILVTIITSDGVEALKTGMMLASALNRELVVWSADAATNAALDIERDRQQAKRLGDRAETFHPGFQQFLSRQPRSSIPTSAPSSPISPPIHPSLKSVTAAPTLVASPYTSDSWYTSHLMSHIA